MKYLITGITGFVAPHLAQILINNGHSVVGTFRKGCNPYDIEDVLDLNIRKITFEECDLMNQNQIESIFKKHIFNGVFHLAGFTHPPSSFNTPVLAFQVNALGSINICEAIRKFNSETIMMQCSTSEVYGVLPDDARINESFPLAPMNPYAVSKAAADLYIAERARNKMIKAFFTRAFSHTGPRRRPNYSISSDAIQVARIINGKQEPIIKVGNLKAKRPVLDVRDVADVYYRLMIGAAGGIVGNGEIFNISAEEVFEIGYYLDLMLDIFNLKYVKTEVEPKFFRPIDIPTQYADSSKVRELLNWKPSIDIRTTMKDLVEYWIKYEGRAK